MPLPNRLEEELRWTVDGRPPKSGRLFPEDERVNEGCGGRPGASDIRDDDMERAWLMVWGAWFSLMLEMELERLRAEAGWGIAEL